MRGIAGYGRYDDDPDRVGCPRAKTFMTPCIARDGHLALADRGVCVGCGSYPRPLLDELREATPGRAVSTGATRTAPVDANLLRDLVRKRTTGLHVEDTP